ncbi:MAG: RHS repeat-associated core domain-containing protein, partial [Pirellula sp.]
MEKLEARRVLSVMMIGDSSQAAPMIQRVGTWATITGSGYGGSVLRSSAPSNNSESLRWSFNVWAPGTYRVSATWNGANETNSASAQYFHTQNGVSVNFASVNQKLAPNDFFDSGVHWKNLGTVVITSTIFTVGLNEGTGGFVVADAIRLQRVEQELVIDSTNVPTAQSIRMGSWTQINGQGGFQNTVLQSASPADGSKYVDYMFQAIEPGMYRVSVTWNAGNPANGSNVPVQLFRSVRSTNTFQLIGNGSLNQQIAPDDFLSSNVWWETVGVFSYVGGDMLTVRLRDQSNGLVTADAIRIERLTQVTNVGIVDESDSGFSKSGWFGSTTTMGGYKNSIAWTAFPVNGSEVMEWSFLVAPGVYRLSATWQGGVAWNGSNTPITVLSGSQVVGHATLNQRLAPDDYIADAATWEHIGVFTVTSTELRVRMTDLGDGNVTADAFRIQRVASSPDNIAPAVSIPIVNPSFESQVLADGGYIPNAVTGWTLTHFGGTAVTGVLNPSSVHFDGGLTTNGQNQLLLFNGMASQLLNHIPLPNHEYRLQIDLGDRLDAGFIDWRVELRSGEALLAYQDEKDMLPTNGGYTTATLVYITPAMAPTQPLEIRIIARNISAIPSFDNIRLTMRDLSVAANIAPPVSVPIVNPSFESQLLPDGGYIPNVLTGWNLLRFGAVGHTGLLNPSVFHFAGGLTTHGENQLLLSNGMASQVLTHVPLPNKEYRLQIDLGDRLDAAFIDWRMELRSGGVLLAYQDEKTVVPVNGGFATSSLVYVTSTSAPTQPLEIRIMTQNPSAIQSFDNVRLTMRDFRYANPIAQDDNYYTESDTDLVVTTSSANPPLLANDFSYEGVTAAPIIVAHPTRGIISSLGSNGTFTYRPDPGFSGYDTFTYRTSNGVSASSIATVQIAVGTRLFPRENKNSNVFNAVPGSQGFGIGYMNIPSGSSSETDGAMAKTGGLMLVEDVLPNMSLVYRSDSLTRPIVEIETQLAPGLVPSGVFAQLIFNGVAYPEVQYATNTLTQNQKIRVAMQADGRSLPTGMYNFQVTIRTTGPSRTHNFSGRQAIVNRSQSVFGSGWSLDGLDRLVEQSNGVMLVHGNGDTLWFPKQGSSYGFADGDTTFRVLTKNADNSFVIRDKFGLVSSYSSAGLLLSVRDRFTNVTSFTYADRNGDGLAHELTSITEPYGRVINLNYTSGKVTSIQHYSGRTTQLTHAGVNLAGYSLTDPDGAGQLLSPNIVFAYSGSTLTGRTNAVQETTSFTFNPTHGRLSQVTYANTETWGVLPSEVQGLPIGPTGNVLFRPSDAFARITDGQGKLWQFLTDRYGNITQSITPLGNQRITLRNSNGQAYDAYEPDPDGTGPLQAPRSRFGYNSVGSMTIYVAPDGGEFKQAYSELHQQIMVTVDPVGRSNRFVHDSMGNDIHIVDGAGNIRVVTYNSRGLPTSITYPDPDGPGPLSSTSNSFQYDALGRLIAQQQADLSVVSFGYNTADQLVRSVDELAKVTTFVYDALGRNISIVNRVNATTQFRYDAMSRVIKHIDPRLNETDIQYNNRGWVSSYQLPDPDGAGPLPRPENILLYDSRGNLTRQRDEGGLYVGTVNYEYDDDNRLEFRYHPMYGNLKEGYVYDRIGRLTRVNRVPRDAEFTLNPNPPSNGWLDIQYDSLGRIQSKRSFEGAVLKHEETYEYNLAGELTARIDGNGNRSENVYDSRGLLVRETLPDPDGNGPQYPLSISYVYDNLGRNTAIDRGFGRVTHLEYNSRNWITKEIQPDPDGSGPLTAPATVFGYNIRGDLTTITSPMGRVTTSVYDDAQRLISRIDPDPDGAGPLLSPISTWAYNEVDWLTSSTDAVGVTTTFLYDELGRTTQIHHPDPDGAGPLPSPIAIYTYDPKGLKSISDPIGIQASYERDARGRVTEVTVPSGSKTSYEYNFYDQVTKILEPDPDNAGSKPRPWTRLKYDDHGRLFRKEDQREKVTEFGYDSFSNLTQIVDNAVPVGPNSASDTTTFQYDALNRQISETNSLGSRIYIYNVAGNLTKTVDRNNRGTSYVYDNLDRLIREEWTSTPGTFNATVVTGEDGAVRNEQQNIGWNASVSTTNVTGTFLLGFNGQYTSNLSWNADSATIQSALEALSNVGAGNVAVTVSAPTTFSRTFSITFRNARGGQNQNQVQIWTSNMVATAGTVAAFAQTLVNGVTTSENQTIQIAGWNTSNQGHWTIAYGNEISPPLSPAAIAGDVANALNAFTSLDGVTVTASGTGGFHITFGGIHAGVNMLPVRVDTTNLRRSSPLRTITSSYNADSELMSVSDPSATINYVRDNLGRATTVQNILGTYTSLQFTFHQSFNAVDQRTELRAVHGNNNDFRNTYAYDNLRRLTQIVQTGQAGSSPVVDKRVSFEYNTQGLRSKLSRFESTSSAHPVATTDYSYDTTKRLTGIAHKQGTTNLNTYSLIYDDMHRITSITSTLDGKVDFDYDKRSQLTSVVDTTASGGYNDVSQTLAYDQRGNRTGTGYTVNSDNRLTAAPNGVGMTYDNEGNLTSITTSGSPQKRLEWDHRNRLTKVSIGNADWVTYEYDAFNRMVKRTQSGTFNNTYFAYDEGINPLLQWEDGYINTLHRYLWSDSVDELLADEQFLEGMTAPNTKWAMSDHQGTIKDIVDYNPATGVASVDRHRKYDPFGDRRGAALPTDIVFGYTGKYFDEATGLQNNWNRWYDPKQGRFISQDPIGFAGGDENLYRYVGNGPTNATDPSGFF